MTHSTHSACTVVPYSLPALHTSKIVTPDDDNCRHGRFFNQTLYHNLMTLLLVGHDRLNHTLSLHMYLIGWSITQSSTFFQAIEIWWTDTWMPKTTSKCYGAATEKEPLLKIIAHTHETSWKVLAQISFFTGPQAEAGSSLLKRLWWPNQYEGDVQKCSWP